MPAPVAPSRTPPIGTPPVGTIILLVLAVILYAAMMACIADARGSDAFGRSLALAVSALIGTVLWVAMGGLLIVAAIKGEISLGARIACSILLPASCVAMWIAGDAYGDGDRSAIGVAALLPPLIVLYALRARFPSLRRMVGEGVANIVLGGIIILLTATPLLKSALPERRDPVADARAMVEEKARQDQEEQRQREDRDREAAKFAALNPDSSLRDYLDFLMGGDSRYREALAGARLVKSRQADAVALLQQGKIDRLTDLWQLDIEPASMCAAYGVALSGMASNIAPGRPNSIGVALDLERQLPNIRWLVAGRCDFAAIFEPLEKNLRIVADSSRITKLADTLAELRQVK
jgi:hypothetical protein